MTDKEDPEILKICIKDGTKSVFVTADQLLYIKSDGNYCIYQTAAHKYLERRSLSSLEKELPTPFVRCHKSYIVNTDLIEQQTAKEVEISGHKVPLGRKYKVQLSTL